MILKLFKNVAIAIAVILLVFSGIFSVSYGKRGNAESNNVDDEIVNGQTDSDNTANTAVDPSDNDTDSDPDAGLPVEPTEPTEPTTPTEPTIPTEPTEPNTPVTPVSQYDKYIMSAVNGLNVREKPGVQYGIVGQINKQEMMKFVAKDGDWYETVYKGKKAYVFAQYIEEKELMVSGNNTIEDIINFAENLLGSPYLFGAERYMYGPNVNPSFQEFVFDCSSLMQYVFYMGGGIRLDETSRAQSLQGRKILTDDIERGDLLFFTNSSRKNNDGIEKIGHVALYLGNGYVLHTATDFCRIEIPSSTMWDNLITVRRVV